MNKDTFIFNGNWAYKISLPAFSGFQERNGAYTSKSSNNPNTGLLIIEFEDDLTDNPDPYPEQLNTLNYIFDNQINIVNAIVSKTLLELPEIIINYDLESETQFQNLNTESVKQLIGISSITIKIVSKDNFSYFDVTGGCEWDEEHDLDILFHKDRIISFGKIDGNSYWEAIKDNETYKEVTKAQKPKFIPKKYYPNPKYNKLKPSQKFANETFEYSLISGGFNQEFKHLTEIGEIDINGKWENQDKTFLEAACWFNNNEIVEFLLSKNADIRYALHQCVGYNNNPTAMELLLNHGADINSQYLNGNTILFELVNSLEGIYRTIDYFKSTNNEIDDSVQIKFLNVKTQIEYLIKKGADPFLKNAYQFNCFDIMRNSNEFSKQEVNNFLTRCLAEK